MTPTSFPSQKKKCIYIYVAAICLLSLLFVSCPSGTPDPSISPSGTSGSSGSSGTSGESGVSDSSGGSGVSGQQSGPIYTYELSYPAGQTSKAPLGTGPASYTLFIEAPASEGEEIPLTISSIIVKQNGTIINTISNAQTTLSYGDWYEEGVHKEHYQTQIALLPEDFSGHITESDTMLISITIRTPRALKSELSFKIGDCTTNPVTWLSFLSANVLENIVPVSTLPVNQNPPGTLTPSETVEYPFEYTYDLDYTLICTPETDPVLLLKGSYNFIQISKFIVSINGTQTENHTTPYYNKIGYSDTIRYNHCQLKICPPGYKFQKGDRIRIQLTFSANEEIQPALKPAIIENADTMKLWREIGAPPLDRHTYTTEVPDESTYPNQSSYEYKLVFYEDFSTDYSAENPKWYGIYDQPYNLNNWVARGWDTYNSPYYNTTSNFLIRTTDSYESGRFNREYARFDLKKEGQDSSLVTGTTLQTAVWDKFGKDSIVLHDFNEGIFEIRFWVPKLIDEGSLTFGLINLNADYSLSQNSQPVNSNCVDDKMSLTEIDFFTFTPKNNSQNSKNYGDMYTTLLYSNGSRSESDKKYYTEASMAPNNLQTYEDQTFPGQWFRFRAELTGLYVKCFIAKDDAPLSFQGFGNRWYSINLRDGTLSRDDRYMLFLSASGSKLTTDYHYLVDYIKVYEEE